MSITHNAVARVSLTNRSRTTNQPHRLAGVDGRTSEGRRRRDLIATYVAATGGPDQASPALMNDITRAVDLVLIAERTRAKALRGGAIDLSALTRIEGAADRAVRRLGIKSVATGPKPPTLEEYLAARYPAADEQEADEVVTEALVPGITSH
jgi:hypothetical protein